MKNYYDIEEDLTWAIEGYQSSRLCDRNTTLELLYQRRNDHQEQVDELNIEIEQFIMYMDYRKRIAKVLEDNKKYILGTKC